MVTNLSAGGAVVNTKIMAKNRQVTTQTMTPTALGTCRNLWCDLGMKYTERQKMKLRFLTAGGATIFKIYSTSFSLPMNRWAYQTRQYNPVVIWVYKSATEI